MMDQQISMTSQRARCWPHAPVKVQQAARIPKIGFTSLLARTEADMTSTAFSRGIKL